MLAPPQYQLMNACSGDTGLNLTLQIQMIKQKQSAQPETFTNKVFQTLECLAASDFKRLMKYLNSPYFNQSSTLLRLCEIFLRLLELQQPGFDRKRVWNELFPEEPYDDINFRKYCSDLLKLVQGFMAQESFESDPARKNIELLNYIVQRKVEPLANGAFRQARGEMDKSTYRSLDYFKNMHGIERLYYEMMDFDVKLNVHANIEAISDNLDLFYWIEKLKLFSSVLSQKRTGNYQYALKFNAEILQYLQHYPIEQVPELAIYYYSFLTLYEEDQVGHYFNLRRLLDQFGALMPKKESIELYDSALHYCTGKLNKGDRKFLQEYFDLFSDGLEKGIFIINGELATWRFNNAVAAALRMGKLDWAESFIEKFKGYLPSDNRQNTYTFNLARVYGYQHKYDKVLSLLRDVEYEDVGYNRISKVMQVIAYYELDETDALESFIESFRVFLYRDKKMPQQRRTLYLNLIKYVRRLTRLTSGDKVALEKLRQEIEREKESTVNHEWLLEKIAELE